MICSLERLPVEIQTRILVESCLGSLRTLIRSSPRFYYVYSQDRLLILNKVLNFVLDGIFLDAYAACQYESYWTAVTTTPWLPLDDYLENPDTAPSAPVIDGLCLEAAQKMAYFHLRVVEPLTERYARWALGVLSSSPQAALLTKTEKSRIQRAMYRLQVICTLGISEPQARLEVLDSFGPWAAEQIICVHEFAKERCTSVSMECAWELSKWEPILSPIEDLPPYTNECEFITRSSCPRIRASTEICSGDINVRSLGTILSQGLSVLQETFQAEDLEELCCVIKKNLE